MVATGENVGWADSESLPVAPWYGQFLIGLTFSMGSEHQHIGRVSIVFIKLSSQELPDMGTQRLKAEANTGLLSLKACYL